MTDTGRPIEMCATVLPALLGVCFFWPSFCSNNGDNTDPTSNEDEEYELDDYEDYDYDDYDYDASNADNAFF